MVIHEPSIRPRQGKYCSTTAVPGFVTLGQCPRVVCSQGQAPHEVQKGLDLGVCNHRTADSLHTLTNTQTGVSGINAAQQGSGTVQDLLIRLDKLVVQLVEPPNVYTLQVCLVEALCEPLQWEVLSPARLGHDMSPGN